jgi:hypothetical protein
MRVRVINYLRSCVCGNENNHYKSLLPLPLCPLCHQEICQQCGPAGFCPVCIEQASPEEQRELGRYLKRMNVNIQLVLLYVGMLLIPPATSMIALLFIFYPSGDARNFWNGVSLLVGSMITFSLAIVMLARIEYKSEWVRPRYMKAVDRIREEHGLEKRFSVRGVSTHGIVPMKPAQAQIDDPDPSKDGGQETMICDTCGRKFKRGSRVCDKCGDLLRNAENI